MKFADKYTYESIKTDPKEADKIVLSNDAFAVGEMIEALVNKIEHLRLS